MENEPKKSVRIFEYMDFREFLRDAYQERKKAQTFFSYRYISGKLGVDSGSLSRIFKGERNLDPEAAGRLARILGLDSQEQQFFEALVLYGQARSVMEKNQFLERLFRLRGIKIGTLEERQYSFYKEWYYSALRELLRIHPFDGDWKKLARLLRPAIRPAEAKHAVGVLEELGLIASDPERGYRLTESVITSGDSIRAQYVNNLHLAMGELALRTLQEAKPEERDFSSLTLSLSRHGFAKLKFRLKQFRREVLEMAQQDEGEDCVYQVNMQAFPLSFPNAPEQA